MNRERSDNVVASVRGLFASMDRTYRDMAARFGFTCAGCEENCCSSVFRHHTHLEFLLLREGIRTLTPARAAAVRRRAESVTTRQDSGGRAPCPILDGSACSLYAYRPMVCRLHGLPHEFRHPSRGRQVGPGCHRFHRNHPHDPVELIDRTDLYRELATLEKTARQALGISAVPGRTIAELILLMD